MGSADEGDGADRVIVEVAGILADDSALCALVREGPIIYVGVNRRHERAARVHAAAHVARGVEGVQLCSVDCGEARVEGDERSSPG